MYYGYEIEYISTKQGIPVKRKVSPNITDHPVKHVAKYVADTI